MSKSYLQFICLCVLVFSNSFAAFSQEDYFGTWYLDDFEYLQSNPESQVESNGVPAASAPSDSGMLKLAFEKLFLQQEEGNRRYILSRDSLIIEFIQREPMRFKIEWIEKTQFQSKSHKNNTVLIWKISPLPDGRIQLTNNSDPNVYTLRSTRNPGIDPL